MFQLSIALDTYTTAVVQNTIEIDYVTTATNRRPSNGEHGELAANGGTCRMIPLCAMTIDISAAMYDYRGMTSRYIL
jgi:hypothetical protein